MGEHLCETLVPRFKRSQRGVSSASTFSSVSLLPLALMFTTSALTLGRSAACVLRSHVVCTVTLRIGVVEGDFNTAQLAPCPRDHASRVLMGAFAGGVEIIHPAATRFSAATVKASHTDRYIISGPRSRWLASRMEVQVPPPMPSLRDRSVTMPLSTSISVWTHAGVAQRACSGPPPPARTPEFAAILAANIREAHLNDWEGDPVERWRYHKWVVHSSLDTARRMLPHIVSDDSVEAHVRNSSALFPESFGAVTFVLPTPLAAPRALPPRTSLSSGDARRCATRWLLNASSLLLAWPPSRPATSLGATRPCVRSDRASAPLWFGWPNFGPRALRA